MKAVIIMFDSLNRVFLPPYGCDWVHAPNFERLMQHTVAFDNCYAGSLPCMPARRELHTGRYNFLHRGWSPMEPFDDSVPEILKNNGIYTHLISDHGHYWEDGGATYHGRYSSWEATRGNEGDRWKADLDASIMVGTNIPVTDPGTLKFRTPYFHHEGVNRNHRPNAEASCGREVTNNALEFLDTNHEFDNWFLQIEYFDPHEPFYTFEDYLKFYEVPDIGTELDWPPYDKVKETPEEVEHIRMKYAALVSKCDDEVGRVLDALDKYDLWKDTMVICNTDHGYLLGEHGWWAKNAMPCYDEIVHTPLFIWDPRTGKTNEHREALVQTIDLGPTLLEFFGLPLTKDMQGKPLVNAVANDEKVRDYALFGYHCRQLNITDGRYVYMRGVEDPDEPQFSYTLMPTNMANFFGKELEGATLAPPFSFTKNMPVLKVPLREGTGGTGTALYDLWNDPKEEHPIHDEAVEARMTAALRLLLHESEAPEELYKRYGL